MMWTLVLAEPLWRLLRLGCRLHFAFALTVTLVALMIRQTVLRFQPSEELNK
jgi:hypothetical protein